jgi:hypothetical protein
VNTSHGTGVKGNVYRDYTGTSMEVPVSCYENELISAFGNNVLYLFGGLFNNTGSS